MTVKFTPSIDGKPRCTVLIEARLTETQYVRYSAHAKAKGLTLHDLLRMYVDLDGLDMSIEEDI